MDARNSQQEAKQQMLKEFRDFLHKVDDHEAPANIRQFVSLLHHFMRINTFTPPFVEIMAVIKQEKPRLYHATRRSLTSSSNLQFLFQVEIDPKQAVKRLEHFAAAADFGEQ